jgi:folate-dependent phosphoribosylglycinamide formyltransferase PurN
MSSHIQRIAIVTTAEHSCALYLAANLAESNLKVRVFSQMAPKYAELSRPYLNRLLKRRGVRVFADNLLLALVEAARYKAIGRHLLAINSAISVNHNWPIHERQKWAQLLPEDRVVQISEINSADGIQAIRQFSPDLILLAGAPIITGRVIELASCGVLNPHCGITPEYAGSSPVVWPLCDNRPFDIGYTIHFVVPRVDAGPIVEQARIPWRTDWSFSTISSYVLQVMYERLLMLVQDWALSGVLPTARRQDVSRVRPPAGQCAYWFAERNKTRLLRQGKHVITPPEWQGDFRITTDVGRAVFLKSSSDNGGTECLLNTAASSMF